MSINKNTLGELLKAYKEISKIIEDIEMKDIEQIKQDLEFILAFPLGEALFSLFERQDIDNLEKSLSQYIIKHEKTDPDEFLNFISLYLRRVGKN